MLELLFLAHLAAIVVVNVTDRPDEDDTSKWGKAYPWIEKAAGIFTDKARQ